MIFDSYVKSLLFYSEIQELPAFLYDKNPAEFYRFMNEVVRYKPQIFESVSRPPLDIITTGGDCGEKTKCCMMYFIQKGIDYEIVFQQQGNKYHVFPRAQLAGQFIDFDTTYGLLQIGQRFVLDEVARFRTGARK